MNLYYLIALYIVLIIVFIILYNKIQYKNTIEVNNNRILPLSGSEPTYNENLWNTSNIVKSHNCYAYMLDDIMMDIVRFPQPGIYSQINTLPDNIVRSRIPLNHIHTCDNVFTLLQDDIPELYAVNFNERCKPGFYKGFLTVDPGDDYHFYRQDSDGLFSHKPGRQPVRRHDKLGHDIYRPDLSHKNYGPANNYSENCQYFCAPVETDIKYNLLYN